MGKGIYDDLVDCLLGSGLESEVKRILSQPDFDPKHAMAELAFCIAASRGNTAAVRLLLDHGVSPNAEDSKGETAIMAATCTLEMLTNTISLLLQRGANVKQSYGVPPERLRLVNAVLSQTEGSGVSNNKSPLKP